ncbi:hypothetical protein HT031_004541 [Scenedesmus sp. PABB004]|nr:hypothetical protein HT031_004541 [Scenedesmus sp. PABB004]
MGPGGDGGGLPLPPGLSPAGLDAIGFAGGGVLAVCLVPQIGKIILSRSARDISITWSLLYIVGLTLSLVYLILKNALAAWIPLVIEILGCLVIIALKLFFEHTAAGRRWSGAELPPPRGPRSLAAAAAAAAADASLGGVSHVSSLGGSRHGGSRHGGSRHGGGSKHGGGSRHGGTEHVEVVAVAAAAAAAHDGSSRHGAGAVGAGWRAPASPRQGAEQPLFGPGWRGLQAVQPMARPQPAAHAAQQQ